MQITLNIRTSLIVSIPMLCLLLFGCGQSDSQKLSDEIKHVISWAATAHMIADSWSKGAAPSAYSRRSFENISEQLNQSLDRIQSTSANGRPQMMLVVERLQHTISRLYIAIKQQDRDSVNQLNAQLRDLDNALTSILNQIDQKQ